MQRGWDATGKLSAVWDRVGGRDGLALAAGIAPTTLSGYNSGERKLGIVNARKIAGVKQLGVTIFDLGAPATDETAPDLQTLNDHLRSLEAELERLGEAVALLAGAQQRVLRDQLLHVLDGAAR